MSRIGRRAIKVPAGVKVAIGPGRVTVEGPGGKLSTAIHPEVKVTWDETEKAVHVAVDSGLPDFDQINPFWGTARATIQNMIIGVTKGYEKTMEVVGVGWTAAVQGKQLKLVVGYANPIFMDIPAALQVSVEKSFVKIKGPDKQLVGQFASEMRSKRKPEPYNGKGIKYTDEVIRRKQGKQFGA